MHAFAELQRFWTFDDLSAYLDSLPDDVDWRCYEIDDGALVVSPPPLLGHGASEFRLGMLLGPACPADALVLGQVGVDLAPSYRIPDLVVVRRAGFRPTSRLARPGDVLLVVEVESPSSITRDRITKPAQYAAAGIPSYWRVETEPEPRLTAYRLEPGAAVFRQLGTWGPGATARLTDPFPVAIPVDDLLPPTVDGEFEPAG